jgi:hypothetical protein
VGAQEIAERRFLFNTVDVSCEAHEGRVEGIIFQSQGRQGALHGHQFF